MGLDNRIQITFKDYYSNPEKCTKDIYDQWNIPFTPEYQASLNSSKKEHDQYKKIQSYKNPDLKDLDLTMEIVEKRYSKYIETVGLSTKQLSPTAPVKNPGNSNSSSFQHTEINKGAKEQKQEQEQELDLLAKPFRTHPKLIKSVTSTA